MVDKFDVICGENDSLIPILGLDYWLPKVFLQVMTYIDFDSKRSSMGSLMQIYTHQLSSKDKNNIHQYPLKKSWNNNSSTPT